MTFNSVVKPNIGDATKKELFDGMIDNQDSFDTDITSLQAGAGRIFVFNAIFKKPTESSTGQIIYSWLTLAEFQARYGAKWILGDGTGISGSELNSLRSFAGNNIPDVRGRFPRNKLNGKTLTGVTEQDLGAIQDDEILAHDHGLQFSDTLGLGGTLRDAYVNGNQSGIAVTRTNVAGTNLLIDIDGAEQRLTTLSEGPGGETRVKEFTANSFIRTDEDSFDKLDLFKAPIGFNIVTAEATTLIAGTAGTLDVDVKVGSSLASLSTIFSQRPTVAFGAGNFATSTNAVLSTTAISAGDWISLDLQSFQDGQTDFHFALFGEI